eukprot:TRINITY_DN818_c0_g1_i1.p4 TRINITY_DN818_c0_g1~~TRINITY_DN818_c0_g1_i1.p4  ORF type:complete len:53 (+),score=0.73 TRINITY_DN818_c0_g1_i1:646-804(+)
MKAEPGRPVIGGCVSEYSMYSNVTTPHVGQTYTTQPQTTEMTSYNNTIRTNV